MTIQSIKENLSILTVLTHYNLTPNRNGMLCCPFHSDKKASMKVYRDTDTVYCFAGSCKVNNLDVIDFIMLKEGVTKHKAILKAKELCNVPNQISLFTKPQTSREKMNLETEFNRYTKALSMHPEGKAYTMSRGLDRKQIEVGYKSRKTKTTWGRGCIIFPLKNEIGDIVSLYGRGINGSSHFYQTDRSGLYPGYPNEETKTLILLESIIDTACLLQLNLPYTLLSLYGTNGLTTEHKNAIAKLKGLEEIILMLDGDDAGRSAMGEHAAVLHRLLPGVKVSRADLPQGEDVNSLFMAHDDREGLFNNLIANRDMIDFKPKASIQKAVLNITNPHNLIYKTILAEYQVRGGVRYSIKDFDHLKITLVIINDEGRKSRNKLDLYEDKQVEKVSRVAGEKLDLRPDLIELDIQALTDQLETYREKRHRDGEQKKPTQKAVPLALRTPCLDLLKNPDLMQVLDGMMEAYGIIGERNNRRLGFCIVSSYGMLKPLHGLIQGSSGSGKTHLLSLLCSLVPDEVYIPITRATDNSFYNYQPYDLKNKLISVEDKDAMSEEASLAFRELQSKEMVSSSTTGQDQQGQSQSFIKIVYGPIASLGCTTKGELYLDDMNRCFLLAIDESPEQTAAVIDYQKREAAGLVDKSKRTQIQNLIQNALRMLKPYEVVIPYAPQIHLPEDVKDKRRLNSLYLSLVKQITLLHQYQRKTDDQGRLIATIRDLELANEIMFDAIVLKVDELHGPLRSFYEKLKQYLNEVAGEQKEKYEFRQRDIRQALRLSRSGVANYIKELLQLEYIQITGGSEWTGYRYKVSYWDDNNALRQRIKLFLTEQIENLK